MSFALTVSTDSELNAHHLYRGVNSQTPLIFSAANRHVEARVAAVDVEPFGINRLLVDTAGVFQPDKFLEEWSKSLKFQRNEFHNFSKTIHSLPRSDSHLLWLLNMMISALQAQMIVTDKSYDPATKTAILAIPEYRDSHYSRAFQPAMGITSIELKAEAVATPAPAKWKVLPVVDFCDVLLPYLSGPAMNFAASHLFGRSKSSPLNIDIDLPSCKVSLICADTDANPTQSREPYDPTDFRMMWGVIAAITRFHRIEHDFSAALQILSFLAFAPEPDTIEGTVWKDIPIRVHIPAFYSLRSQHEFFRSGEAFRVTESRQCESQLSQDPLVGIIAHAAVNAYAQLGFFDSAARHGSGKRFFEALPPELSDPTSAFPSAAAHCSGIHIPSYFQAGVGLTLAFDAFRGGKVLDVINVATDEAQPLPINFLPTPCPPSFLLGRVPENMSTMAHLRDFSFTAQPAEEIPLSRLQVVQFAQYLRLAGYDTTYDDLHTGASIMVWASAKSKMLQPHAVPFYSVEHLYLLQDVIARENARNMPAAETLLEVGFTVAYSSHFSKITSVGSKSNLAVRVAKTPMLPKMTFDISTPYVMNNYKVSFTPYPGSYFREVEVPTGETPPCPVQPYKSSTIHRATGPPRDPDDPDVIAESVMMPKRVTPGLQPSSETIALQPARSQPPTSSVRSGSPTVLVAGGLPGEELA